jgi:leader peptidase (prepilin peptidase) / N-methyltransferase
MWGVAFLYRKVRGKEGMGMGDVKLMGMIGAFLGIELTVAVVMLGSIIGSLFGVTVMLLVFRKRLERIGGHNLSSAAARARAWRSANLLFSYFPIAFGVFLGTAALVAAFAGAPVMRWYLGLCR